MRLSYGDVIMLENLKYFGIGTLFLGLAISVEDINSLLINASQLDSSTQTVLSFGLFVLFAYFILKGGVAE